ncbi:MAG: TIGR03620 family F420-dependent LLM class oxidoreductase [Actinomycetia bacterium]|nr:TIGR03620 family F420-dependent LLM class oxidoreductase [Actinomycetes bacterium]
MTQIDLGVLLNADRMAGPTFIDCAKRMEATGIESLWLAELFGREPFAAAGAILATTTTLRVGTAIANVYARDGVAAAAASATLAELSGNRFELGLGVSNRPLVQLRGHQWTPPAPRLAAYLDGIRSAKLAVPEHSYPIQVAAHGPKMLEVASTKADGVFTYLMTPEHTARTRGGLPAEATLAPMMMCLLCPEEDEARRLARKAVAVYMGLDYYHRAWRTLGFDDTDFVDGGSDRLIDSILAWGTIDNIRARIAAHREAGATRLVVIPLNPAGGGQPDWNLLDELVLSR